MAEGPDSRRASIRTACSGNRPRYSSAVGLSPRPLRSSTSSATSSRSSAGLPGGGGAGEEILDGRPPSLAPGRLEAVTRPDDPVEFRQGQRIVARPPPCHHADSRSHFRRISRSLFDTVFRAQPQPRGDLLVGESFHLPDRDVAEGLVVEPGEQELDLLGHHRGELGGRLIARDLLEGRAAFVRHAAATLQRASRRSA